MGPLKCITLPAIFFLLLLFSCSQSDIKHKSEVPPPPHAHTSFTENDLLEIFNLQKGSITASAAAEKIKSESLSRGFVTQIIAYNDKDGSFTVKIRGEKNGRVLEVPVTISGFTHPCMADAESVNPENKLILNKAVETNLPIDQFIKAANEAEGNGYVFFKIKLNNGKYIDFGKYDSYNLTAVLTKDTNNKIKIQPQYKRLFKTLREGVSTVTEEQPTLNHISFSSENYLTENDVCKYILSKTNNDFVRSDDTLFASSLYSLAKETGGVPLSLFNMLQIQSCIDLYSEKNPNEHFMNLDIRPGIYKPKEGGIKADDSKGELLLCYCIATQEQLEHQISAHSDVPPITAISEQITKNGYKIANTAVLKELFDFIIDTKEGSPADAQKEWKNYTGFAAGFSLLDLSNNPPVQSFSQGIALKKFRITINHKDNPADIFTSGTSKLSVGKGECKILLYRIILNKQRGETDLKVQFFLSEYGGDPVEVIYTPNF